MKLREALIQQAPSLALQRAAADEIARLDAALECALRRTDELSKMQPAQPGTGHQEIGEARTSKGVPSRAPLLDSGDRA